MNVKAMAMLAALAAGFAAQAADAKATAPAKAEVVPAKAEKAKPEKAKLSLVAARAQIGAVIAEPKKMTEVMQQLSAADQKAFVGEVNAAIAKMPASVTDRAATFLAVNHAAMEGVARGNVPALVAEIFATVPVQYLPAISESFGNDFFNRGAGQSSTMTKPTYMKQAQEVMKVVQPRTKQVDNDPVRDTLALEMFIQGAADETPETKDTLVASSFAPVMQPTVQGWLSEAASGNYGSMMAYAGVESADTPSVKVVIAVVGPQEHDALLSDLGTGQGTSAPISDMMDQKSDSTVVVSATTPAASSTARPVTTDPTKPWNPTQTRDDTPQPTPEPEPYQLQEL